MLGAAGKGPMKEAATSTPLYALKRSWGQTDNWLIYLLELLIAFNTMEI